MKLKYRIARVFPNKTEASNWIHENCHKCQRLLGGWKECRLSYYIFEGLSTRRIPKDVLREIGRENNKLFAKCLKFEETENERI